MDREVFSGTLFCAFVAAVILGVIKIAISESVSWFVVFSPVLFWVFALFVFGLWLFVTFLLKG